MQIESHAPLLRESFVSRNDLTIEIIENIKHFFSFCLNHIFFFFYNIFLQYFLYSLDLSKLFFLKLRLNILILHPVKTDIDFGL